MEVGRVTGTGQGGAVGSAKALQQEGCSVFKDQRGSQCAWSRKHGAPWDQRELETWPGA